MHISVLRVVRRQSHENNTIQTRCQKHSRIAESNIRSEKEKEKERKERKEREEEEKDQENVFLSRRLAKSKIG